LQCVITRYIDPLIALMSALVGVAVTISIIYAGIQYGSSADSPQKVSQAKQRIVTSVFVLVGFFVLYQAFSWLTPGGLNPATSATSTNIPCNGGGSFLGLPNWYEYICDSGHDLRLIGDASGPSDLPLVGLAVMEILLRIVGFVSLGYMIFGSVKYVVSQGEPNKVSEAKGTIINALIGLIIASLAVALVSFIGNRVG
jgi:hypothetical protein